MKNVLQLLIYHPLSVALMAILVGLGGIYSANHMGIDLFGHLDIPVVNIITHYPAASPENVETLITRPIENQMRGIRGTRRVASISVQGISKVTVEFNQNVSVTDARYLVQARLGRLKGLLPAGTEPTVENIGTTLQEVLGYAVYGGNTVKLRNIVRYELANRMMGVHGVSSVKVLGGEKRGFIVKTTPQKLAQLGIPLTTLIDTLKRHNISTSASYIKRSSQEYLIRCDARIQTLDDIRSIPIETKAGDNLPLGTIASVADGVAFKHYQIRADRNPAVVFFIRKQPGISPIVLSKQVTSKIKELKHLFPKDTRIKKFYDQSEIISEAKSAVAKNLIEGMILVIIVLVIFIGRITPALIVALTIPITFLASLWIMYLFGLSLDIVTMSALTLAIGMIVDDAIVVADNILRHQKHQRQTDIASIEGTLEIASADTSGTFTTVFAFVPLILVTGIAGVFLKPFGVTIGSALLISLIVSLTLIPVSFANTRRTLPFITQGKRDPLDFIRTPLQRCVKVLLHHRWIAGVLALILLTSGILAIFLPQAGILPPIDEGALLIEYVTPPGTSLSESSRIGDILDKIALEQNEVSCVYRRTGSPEIGYQIEGVNRGELLIKLKPKSQRTLSADSIMLNIKKSYSQIPGVVFLYHQPTQEKIDESFSGLPALFGVTIFGTDTNKLTTLASNVENILSHDTDISNIVNNTKIKIPEIIVKPNYNRVNALDVSPAEMFSAIQAWRTGVTATTIIRQNQNIPVIVKLDCENSLTSSADIAELKQLPLATASGSFIPLGKIAEIKIVHSPPAITRLNGQREITLIAEIDGNLLSVIKRLKTKFAKINLPTGYSIDFTGQYKVLIKTAIEMLFVLLAATLVIFLIMAMQFGSAREPLAILITIPLSLIGAVIALFITHQGLNVSVAMGAITVVGICVNNAIVLLDYANRQITNGKSVLDALQTAVAVRLRPILMTTLTTIAGLLPTAIGLHVGSKLFQPFAIAVIGGLITSTIVTLIIIPPISAYLLKPKINTTRSSR